jgi:putative N6-adenine-specific DNA methylase
MTGAGGRMPGEIFLVATPGLEAIVAEEAREAGFQGVTVGPGGVTVAGGWAEVWRANLELRGPSRVLVRVGSFRAMHLAQLDKRARKFAWGEVLRPDVPVRVEATCHASRIYHAGAAAERVGKAIAEEFGAPVQYAGKAEEEFAGGVALKVRIADDLVTFSVDTSGEGLHKRGHKAQVGKAPMRETMAAMFLRACGYRPGEAVVDPMCGSGTFVIEAAEITAGLQPGRSRGFAFEKLATFDAGVFAGLRRERTVSGPVVGFGSDRDDGAIRSAVANAERAGVAALTAFRRAAVSDLVPPEGVASGLVIVNPPYGARIGDRRQLFALYGAMGRVLRERFAGWRVGIITSDAGLAKATALPFLPMGDSVAHGGLRIALYRTEVLQR